MTVQETLIACVRTIIGSGADVRLYDKQSMWVDDTAHVEITILSMPRIGVDERRVTAEGDSLRERIYGNRSLRVQMLCNTNDQDLAQSGQELADSIVAGFMRTDVEEALALVDLGVPRSLPVRTSNARDDHGDTRSIGIVELWFPWSRSQTGGLIGTIGQVDYTGTIDNLTPPDATITGSVTE